MMWHRRHSFGEVLELKTDEQVVIVAIEVWGAHAPSRADFGASPKCFSCSIKESRWRGANDSTRGASAPQKRGAAGDHATRAPKTQHLCRDFYAHKMVNIAYPKTRSPLRIVLIRFA